jgi:hypothetical protein
MSLGAEASSYKQPFLLDPTWSAQQVAAAARQHRERLYVDHPEVLEICNAFSTKCGEVLDCWEVMTEEERRDIFDLPIIMFPMNDFNVWVARPPSNNGVFIAFDMCLIEELAEFFSAVPGYPMAALGACVLRGALRDTLASQWDWGASWTKFALENHRQVTDGDQKIAMETGFASMLPGIRACVNFLILHECAHFKLGHLRPEAMTATLVYGNRTLAKYKKQYDQEIAADEWATRILARADLEIFSAHLPSIELMFYYLLMIETFDSERRRLEGFLELPLDHPPAMERLQRIQDVAAPMFENASAIVDSNRAISGNLHNRYVVWKHIKNLTFEFCPLLAYYYFHEPEKTIEMHTEVRRMSVEALKQRKDNYIEELREIEIKHGITKMTSNGPRPRLQFQLKRIFRNALSKWF